MKTINANIVIAAEVAIIAEERVTGVYCLNFDSI